MDNKKAKTARVYSSEKVRGILRQIDPLEKEKVREKMLLASKVQSIIEERGFTTQKNFAQKIQKQPSEITKWLSGIHNFTIDTLVEIKYSLGVEMIDFFKREPNNTSELQTEVKGDAQEWMQIPMTISSTGMPYMYNVTTSSYSTEPQSASIMQLLINNSEKSKYHGKRKN